MESSGAERKGRIFCPPTVSDALWTLVPADSREELLLHVARQLRAGYHPKETVQKFLVGKGLWQAPTLAAPPTINMIPPAMMRRAAPAPSAAQLPLLKTTAPSSLRVMPMVEPENFDDDAFDFDDDDGIDPSAVPTPTPIKFNKPLHPYGLRIAPATTDVPKGEIGVALHRLLGFPGEPGKKAADMEASVLRAIASDPALAAFEPDQLGNLGCIVPEHFLASIVPLILAEAERVQADILSRRKNGDPTAEAWSNPAEWVDNE
jgi:hypothetical protein